MMVMLFSHEGLDRVVLKISLFVLINVVAACVHTRHVSADGKLRLVTINSAYHSEVEAQTKAYEHAQRVCPKAVKAVVRPLPSETNAFVFSIKCISADDLEQERNVNQLEQDRKFIQAKYEEEEKLQKLETEKEAAARIKLEKEAAEAEEARRVQKAEHLLRLQNNCEKRNEFDSCSEFANQVNDQRALIALKKLCFKNNAEIVACRKLHYLSEINVFGKDSKKLQLESSRQGCKFLDGVLCSKLHMLRPSPKEENEALNLAAQLLHKECNARMFESCDELRLLSTKCNRTLMQCKEIELTLRSKEIAEAEQAQKEAEERANLRRKEIADENHKREMLEVQRQQTRQQAEFERERLRREEARAEAERWKALGESLKEGFPTPRRTTTTCNKSPYSSTLTCESN